MSNVRYSSAPLRRAELLRRVAVAGYVSSSDAAASLGVSEMTIRRDLHQLAAAGHVQRVVGGASLVPPAAGAPFEQRTGTAAAEKDAVARAVAPLLATQTVVALDAGTAVAALVPYLSAGLTVVTHSLPIVNLATDRDDLEVITLGGAYHRATRSFTGPLTRAGLADLAVDVAVVSASAAGRSGVYSTNAWDADIKRAMLKAAQRVVLLLDRNKLAARAPMRFMGLEDANVVAVDDGADDAQLALLREKCAQVVVAEVVQPAPVGS